MYIEEEEIFSIDSNHSDSNLSGSSPTANTSYCTPRTYSTIERLNVLPDLNHIQLPPNIWSRSYKNFDPLDKYFRVASTHNPEYTPNYTSNYTSSTSNYTSSTSNYTSNSSKHTSDTSNYSSNTTNYTSGTSNHTSNTTSRHFPTSNTPQIYPIYPSIESISPKTIPRINFKSENHHFKNYLGNYFEVTDNSKFFVIKSYNLLDVNASFINNVWASTELGNKRLSKTYKSCDAVYLFFSVNGSGKFCGIARMASDIDFNQTSDIWSEMKWKGIFKVDWLLIKDIPNKYFQQFKIPTNDNKSVTNSRDTQEIPFDIGISMFKIFSTFKHSSSFLI